MWTCVSMSPGRTVRPVRSISPSIGRTSNLDDVAVLDDDALVGQRPALAVERERRAKDDGLLRVRRGGRDEADQSCC